RIENAEWRISEQNRDAILMKIKPALPVWPFNSPFSILHSPLLKSLCDFNHLFGGHFYLFFPDGLLHAGDGFGGG
ncbi:hypothetical protein NE688_21180, partial [Eubacterium callanderi]|uniref:hypothetical protein n=1 Tax=Eubacterium callanderi TaxID=53442 RepID=UPI001EE001BC